MTNVRMTALTVLHISSVQAENILTGEEFEVPGYVADELIQKGFAARAEEVAAPSPAEQPEPEAADDGGDPVEEKAAEPLENKAELVIDNKAAPKARARSKAN